MITLRRVVITALLLFAVGLLWWATTQDADQSLEPQAGRIDSAVEEIVPEDGDAALRQSQIGIDLEPGWTAVLAIDGTEIPEDQLQRSEPLNQVFFTPGDGQVIEELDAGTHNASASIWRTASQTRESGRTVNWSFSVT